MSSFTNIQTGPKSGGRSSIPSETADSILSKVGVAKRYNLQGIAIWRLGLVSDKMWTALRSGVQPRK